MQNSIWQNSICMEVLTNELNNINETQNDILIKIALSTNNVDNEIVKKNKKIQELLINKLGMIYILENRIDKNNFFDFDVLLNVIKYDKNQIKWILNYMDMIFTKNQYDNQKKPDAFQKKPHNQYLTPDIIYDKNGNDMWEEFMCCAIMNVDDEKIHFSCGILDNFILPNLDINDFSNNLYLKYRYNFDNGLTLKENHEYFLKKCCDNLVENILIDEYMTYLIECREIIKNIDKFKIFVNYLMPSFFSCLKNSEMKIFKMEYYKIKKIFKSYMAVFGQLMANIELFDGFLTYDNKLFGDIEPDFYMKNLINSMCYTITHEDSDKLIAKIFSNDNYTLVFDLFDESQKINIFRRFTQVLRYSSHMFKNKTKDNLIDYILHNQNLIIEHVKKSRGETILKNGCDYDNMKKLFTLCNNLSITIEQFAKFKIETIAIFNFFDMIPKEIICDIIINQLSEPTKSTKSIEPNKLTEPMCCDMHCNEKFKNIIEYECMVNFLLENNTLLEKLIVLNILNQNDIINLIEKIKTLDKFIAFKYIYDCKNLNTNTNWMSMNYLDFFSQKEIFEIFEQYQNKMSGSMLNDFKICFPDIEQNIEKEYLSNIKSMQETCLENISKKRNFDQLNYTIKQRGLCNICMINVISMVYTKCGHTVCNDCLTVVKNKCPFCRKISKDIMKIFL